MGGGGGGGVADSTRLQIVFLRDVAKHFISRAITNYRRVAGFTVRDFFGPSQGACSPRGF